MSPQATAESTNVLFITLSEFGSLMRITIQLAMLSSHVSLIYDKTTTLIMTDAKI